MTMSRRVLLAGGACVTAMPVWAHHGFTGRYDVDAPIWIAGLVDEATFAPPHPVLRVRVDATLDLPNPVPQLADVSGALTVRAADRGQMVTVEFPPVQTFFGLAQRLAVGARLELVALRNCRPPNQLRSQWIRLADGAVIARGERMSYMVRGCVEGA